MKTEAAVLVETGKPLVIGELEIPQIQPGQVLVEVAFSGVCHTQVLEVRGFRGHDPYLPHTLGHEGSGTVLEVGPGCKKVKPGDRVILSWIKGEGGDVHGSTYGWQGKNVSAGGITTFGKLSLISENRLTPLPAEMSMREAALVGCAIPTGLGSVFNVAKAGAGQSLAVFGTGGVGLCAVTGAAVAGCIPVIAVDVHDEKEQLCKTMGATHFVNARKTDPLAEIEKIVPGGVDFAIEASGRPEAMERAFESVRHQGGTAVLIGNARFGETMTLNPRQFNMGKNFLGTWGGNSVPDRDYPRYCRLISSRKINVQPLLGKTYGLHEINSAMDDLESGKIGRPLIDMSIAS